MFSAMSCKRGEDGALREGMRLPPITYGAWAGKGEENASSALFLLTQKLFSFWLKRANVFMASTHHDETKRFCGTKALGNEPHLEAFDKLSEVR